MSERGRLQLDGDSTQLVTRLLERIVHDFNNPLAAIMGFSELLLNPALPPDKKTRYAVRIHEQATRLSQLVEMMSSFSSIPEPTLARLDFSRTAQEMLSLREGSFAGLHLGFESIFPAESVVVTGDRNGATRVMTALLNNLEQVFKENPQVERKAMVKCGVEAGHGYLDFVDSGPGVLPDIEEQIFDPFFSTRKSGGLGLGLTVGQNLARRMGGDLLHRRSDYPGYPGACFRFLLPLA